jgi:hypothetical protein
MDKIELKAQGEDKAYIITAKLEMTLGDRASYYSKGGTDSILRKDTPDDVLNSLGKSGDQSIARALMWVDHEAQLRDCQALLEVSVESVFVEHSTTSADDPSEGKKKTTLDAVLQELDSEEVLQIYNTIKAKQREHRQSKKKYSVSTL